MHTEGAGPAKPLGARIRGLRDGAGLTQQQLASRAGVSVGAIRDLEQGRVAQPHPEPRRRIALALGMDTAQWDLRDSAAGAAGLRIGILGPLTVARNGNKMPTLPEGQRVVLGVLALACGAPVRLGSIVDTIWAQEPPASAVAIVQTYVSRIRRAIYQEGEAGRLLRDGAGYSLRLDEGELDLLTFRHLVGQARASRAVGETGAACLAFEQALGLCRGEPLSDIKALREHPAVVALADELATAVFDYADTAADLGCHENALPDLRALVARNPLDEAAQSRLMIALAAAGRQGEALSTYEEVRRRLDEELGVLPGVLLRDTHAKVLRQQTSIPVGQQEARERWFPLFQLPAAPADFTGRVGECARLTAAITPRKGQAGVPLAVVSGPPGAGKTALTLHVAHTVRAEFPDGQLWVHLAGTSAHPREAGEVLGEFLRALGVHGSAIPDTLSERAACYRSRLAGRRILVIADDAASAAQVVPLLPGTAGCGLIVTSRSRLDGLDGAAPLPLDAMTDDDASALLTRLVGEARVAADSAAACSLVQACGALPLALRIAGSKLAAHPSWPLSVMVRRISGAHARLAELNFGDLSVRASIASTHSSLSPRARRAFDLLALMGPADFAEWVPAALLGERDAADVVAELDDRSMLTAVGADLTGEPRYRLHDLLRDFAGECLAGEPAAERDAALRRALGGWLQLAMTANGLLPAEPYFPAPEPGPRLGILEDEVVRRLTADPAAWFTVERVNLQAAVERACQSGHLDLARHLAAHQCAFQHLQYRHADVDSLWTMIGACADEAGDQALARYARIRVGHTVVRRGQAVLGRQIFDRCVEESERAGDGEVLAMALAWRATCAWDLDDFDVARGDAERGLGLALRSGSRVAEHVNLGILSISLALTGRGEEALTFSRRASAIAADLGISFEVEALHNQVFTLYLTGHTQRAVTLCLRGIELTQQIGDVFGEALFHAMLGDAYRGMSKLKDAEISLLRALPVFRDLPCRRFHAVCLLKLGYTYEAMGSRKAISHLEESVRVFNTLSLPRKAEQAQEVLDRCRLVERG